MKLLVIGQSGQLARALLNKANDGIVVTAKGRADLDIADRTALSRVVEAMSPDVIVNTAAFTAVDAAEVDLQGAHRVNVLGAEAVALVSADFDVPLIHVSTDYVFSGEKAEPYCETDPPDPRTVYGRTKLEGERRAAAATKRLLTVRTAWVFSHEGKNFVRTMLALARDRSGLQVVEDQLGSPTYAYDLADCILTLAQRAKGDLGYRWGVVHATNAGEASWYDLAVATLELSRQFGGPTAQVARIRSADYPTAASRPANSRLSCEKLRSEFGVTLRPWRLALRACIEALARANFPVR